MLSKNDVVSNKFAQILMQESTLEGNLVFTKTHFGFILQKITFLKKQDVLLADSTLSFEEVVKTIAEVAENEGRASIIN